MSKVIARTLARPNLLACLIESPELARAVSELPAPAFSALVRKVGVEDAGEIVALATTPQIVAAFDDDLFSNEAPGEREAFDSKRFVTWLEVLLEAGESAAAARFVELGEDFVARALSSLVLVLDNDALLERMSEGGDDVDAADKALESALTEEIDGYLLVARGDEGWDAALSLILALDRDHRSFLVRVLDRGAAVTRGLVEDLDELVSALSDEPTAIYGGRLEELAYLTNVLVAAAAQGGERLRPAQAAEAVLATVGLGAEIVARERRSSGRASQRRASQGELADVVRDVPADVLFRRASSVIAASGVTTAIAGIARDAGEVEMLLKKALARSAAR